MTTTFICFINIRASRDMIEINEELEEGRKQKAQRFEELSSIVDAAVENIGLIRGMVDVARPGP